MSTEWTIELRPGTGARTYGLYNMQSQLSPINERRLESLTTEGVNGELQRFRGERPRVNVISMLYPHSTADVDELDKLLASYCGNLLKVTLRNKPGSTLILQQWQQKECWLEDYEITGRFGRLDGYGAVANSTRTTQATLMLKILSPYSVVEE